MLRNILTKLRRQDRALESYNKALEIEFNSPEAYNNIGNIYAGRGNNREGRSYLRRALLLRPEFAEAYENVALSCIETEGDTSSIENINRAMFLNPVSARLLNKRGLIFHGMEI